MRRGTVVAGVFVWLAVAGAIPGGMTRAAESVCPGSACSGSDSGCGTGGFTALIDQICSLAPTGDCSSRCGCCRSEEAEPFAGVTFGPPLSATPQWPGLGGRGELAGETELCLLRDLGKLPGGGFVNAPGSISLGPLGEAKIAQRVGFAGFDPVGRTMQGFHSVSLCVPPFGCVDDQVQDFTATLLDSPAAAGLRCGDYPFAGAYGLQIDTSDTEHRLDVDLPAIEVFTPYGSVSATPKFHYETALKSGFPEDVNEDREQHCHEFGSSLYPLTGRDDGAAALNFMCALLPRPPYQPGFGGIGQIGLGGRDANPDNPISTPGTPRPDLDLRTARTADEKMPVGAVGASVDFKYDVAGLIPAKFRTDPFSLTANVFVKPAIDSRFASQFQVYGSDAAYQVVEPVLDCHTLPYHRAHVVLQSRADSFVSFRIDAGFNLVLELAHDFGFGTISVTVLERRSKFDVVPPIKDGTSTDGPAAQATFVDAPQPAFDSLTSFSAGPVADPATFLSECFNTPPPAGQTPPKPSFTPDDPRKFTSVLEFPCNLCLGWGGLTVACGPKQGFPADYHCDFADGVCSDPTGAHGCTTYPVPADLLPSGSANTVDVLFPAVQDLAGKQWICDAPQKSGCMDLCTYDPTAAQPLKVVRSAVDLDPDRCAVTATGRPCHTSADCDDGNPCTSDTCAGPSEFGTCRYAPQDGACDDGLFCDGADRCALGACALHDGNPCVTGQGCCDETGDTCVESCPVPGPRCGNGLVQPGEECDDGNLEGGDGCSATCRLECGNGVVDPGETCDDGNTLAGDGCSPLCAIERQPPDCSHAFATTTELWPPNHKWVNVSVSGVTDSTGNPAAVTITGITQDEPLDGLGDGDTCPDAAGIGSATAKLRAERAGAAGVPGDGRVYHVAFTAADGQGGTCSGVVNVCVPHDQRPGHSCVDEGALVTSTGPCD
jgi:cysteine-rich repeat protein